MRRVLALWGIATFGVVVGTMQACGGSGGGSGGNGNGTGGSTPGPDGGTPDTGVPDTGMPDTGVTDATPPTDAPSDAPSDTDAGCPAGWLVAPVVDPPIALPDGGGGVLIHAIGTGTQDYACTAVTVDGGTSYSWVFTGPEADLADCAMNTIGKHFASDGGPGAPEWMTLHDGTYVIGKKLAADTPDGGGSAIPWLLLEATEHGGGTGPLSLVDYVQRVRTAGGLAPSTGCDATTVGTTSNVAYTADYYFFGP